MANLIDRVFSSITYITFGFFGLIWLVYSVVVKKTISKFGLFNIYQSCVISLVFAILGICYDLILKFSMMIGFLGKIVGAFHLFFFGTPMYFGFTLSGLLITIFIGYLVIFVLFGKRPFIPVVSYMIEVNLGI